MNYKIGDTVTLEYYDFGKIKLISTTVKRITKTMIVVKSKEGEIWRFRFNGHQVGGSMWHPVEIKGFNS